METQDGKWIEDEGLLRDEGVVFGLQEANIDDKIEAIKLHYKQKIDVCIKLDEIEKKKKEKIELRKKWFIHLFFLILLFFISVVLLYFLDDLLNKTPNFKNTLLIAILSILVFLINVRLIFPFDHNENKQTNKNIQNSSSPPDKADNKTTQNIIWFLDYILKPFGLALFNAVLLYSNYPLHLFLFIFLFLWGFFAFINYCFVQNLIQLLNYRSEIQKINLDINRSTFILETSDNQLTSGLKDERYFEAERDKRIKIFETEYHLAKKYKNSFLP